MSKNTFFFAAILAIFAAYIYFVEIKEDQLQLEKNNIYSYELSEIQSISIVNDYAEINLLKEGEVWWLDKGQAWQADEFVIHSIFNYIEKKSKAVLVGEVPEDFDQKMVFAEPQLVLIINENIEYYISKVISYDTQLYVKRIEKDRVDYFTVSQEFLSLFNKTTYHFRDKRLITDAILEADYLKLVLNGNTIYNLQEKNNIWFYDDIEIASSRLNAFLYNLQSLSALSIIDLVDKDVLQAQGIDLQQFVEINAQDKVHRLYFSFPVEGKMYVYFRNKLFTVFSNQLDFLAWRRDDFLDRKQPFVVDYRAIDQIIHTDANGNTTKRLKNADVWQNFSFNPFLRAWVGLEVKKYMMTSVDSDIAASLSLMAEGKELLKLSYRPLTASDEIYVRSTSSKYDFILDSNAWLSIIKMVKGGESEKSSSQIAN